MAIISGADKSALELQLEQAKKVQDKQSSPVTMVKTVTGQLVAAQPNSVSQASQLQGVQPPASPMGAAMLPGVNPDQAKMAGTPAQSQATAAQLLATQQREQQGRTERTAAEQSKAEKSQNLQSLGNVGDRVQNLIEKQLQTITPTFAMQAAPATPAMQTARAALQTAIQGGDPAAAMAAYGNLVKQETGKEWDPATTSDLFGSPEAAIQAALKTGMAGAAGAEQVLSPAALQEMGYNNVDEFVQATGLDPRGKTFQQFQDAVAAAAQREFSETSRLKDIMADTTRYGPAERSAARQQLIDMGALQLSGVEEAAHRLEQSVANAGEIEWAGQKLSLADALDDEKMSGLIMSAARDPETLSRLKEQNPDLAKFIEKNVGALQALSDGMEGTEQAFQEIQSKNKELNKATIPGTELSANVMSALYPGWTGDKLVSEAPSMATGSVATYLSGLKTPEEKVAFGEFLNTMGQAGPTYIQALNKMTTDQLKWFTGPGKPLVAHYNEYLANPTDPYLKYAFGKVGAKNLADLSAPSTQQLFDDALSYKALGAAPGDKNVAALVADPLLRDKLKDGILTETEAMQLVPAFPAAGEKRSQTETAAYEAGYKQLQNMAQLANAKLPPAVKKQLDTKLAEAKAKNTSYYIDRELINGFPMKEYLTNPSKFKGNTKPSIVMQDLRKKIAELENPSTAPSWAYNATLDVNTLKQYLSDLEHAASISSGSVSTAPVTKPKKVAPKKMGQGRGGIR